ncbi:MAG: restriction endonuclease subunit S [Candidatus Aenigmatarchaeota archaeon]
MAVYSIINKSQLEGALRLDAEYYQPEYLEMEKLLSKVPFDFLKNLTNKICRGKQPKYVETGKIFAFTSDQIRNDFIDTISARYTDEAFYKNNSKAQVKPFDVLLNSTGIGTLGRVNFYYLDKKAVVDSHITIISTIPEKLDPIFLNVFLKTKFGQYQISRNYSGSSGQIELYPEQIKEFKIFTPSLKIQKDIAALILQAIEWHQKSELFYSQAENLLLEELGLKDFKVEDDLFYIINLSQIKSAHRADAEYFQPKYKRLIKRIEKFSEPLLKVVDNIPARFNPYLTPDKIFKYVELEHINTSIGIIDGYIEILGNEAPSRAKRVLKEKDVIFSSVEGSLKKVALVHKEQEGYLASTGFFQFRCKKFLPEYFLVLAKSIVLQMQFEKETAGTILTAVPKEALKNIIIPILPKLTQQKIADLVQKSHEARKKAKELLEEAKRKVEKLIEENK